MAPLAFPALADSPDVARLVQNRLSRVQQQFSASTPSTLGDLRIVVDELSTISKTCATVLEDLETQDSEIDVATAFKEIEAALDWAKFLQYVQTERSPAEHPYLFRAHRNTTGSIGSYEPPARNVFFNDRLRKSHTVYHFVKAIARHLAKTGLQENTGIKQDIMVTSMSAILEWALHNTKNEWSDNNEDERACLVVFSVRRLRELQGVTIFRIADVTRFLDSQNQAHLISEYLRNWARTSDEYLIMGNIAEEAIVRVIPWTDLMPMRIIHNQFVKAYTLGIYCNWRDRQEFEEICANEVGRMVVEAAAVLAGDNVAMVRQMVALILKPGVFFWGIETDVSCTDINNVCEAILEQGLLEHLSQMSLS